MKRNVFSIILISLIIKILYFVFALTTTRFQNEVNVQPTFRSFINVFKKNDSGWYQKAAVEGYPKITNSLDLGYSYGKYYKQSVWAHFPLYPFLLRSAMHLFNFDFLEGALLLSIIFTASCFLVFFYLCRIVFMFDEQRSFYYTLIFICLPFNYYFSMYYTEALYFTLLGLSFIFTRQKNYFSLALALMALTLIRPNGIASVLPIFIYFIEENGGFKMFFTNILKNNSGLIGKSIVFLSAPFALAIYCIYQKHMTNHYFAFVQAQYGWYKEFMFPLQGLFRRGDFTTQFNSIYVIGFLVISIFCWKKFSLSLNLLIWISMLLPLTSGSVACMPRYISVIFPLTIFTTNFFYSLKNKYFVICICFILQLATFYSWLISHPFSY